MKKIYIIETNTSSFHALKYNAKTNQIDDIQADLIYDNEEYSSSTYKIFYSKEEAIFAFKLLCTFVTSDNITITFLEVDKDTETIKNEKILQKFKLCDEEKSSKDIDKILNEMEF